MRGKDGENNGCNQPAEPSNSMLFCSYYTRLGRLTVNWQLAAMSSQMCTSDSSGGGLLTPDRALIDWLRKFHSQIGGLLCSSLSLARCEAFHSVLFILRCLSASFLFHFLQKKTYGLMWPKGRHDRGWTRALPIWAKAGCRCTETCFGLKNEIASIFGGGFNS